MHRDIQEITAPDLAKQLDEKPEEFQIVDIREMPEIVAGTVPLAEAMPMATIPVRMHELKRDKNVILVCRSGARSAHACMFLQQNGFDNVINLQGGMVSWARNALPIHPLTQAD